MTTLTTLLLACSFLWTASCHPSINKVVYREDNRQDVCVSDNDMLKNIARNSIGALLPRRNLAQPSGDGTYNEHISSYTTLKSRHHLCDDQRFQDQPTLASCSVTLVAPDRVLTAGHCVTQSNCKDRVVLFDYMYTGADCTMPTIDHNNIYSCVHFSRLRNGNLDHALVQLDRPVVGRQYVKVSLTPSLVVGQQISVIGFGSGLPAKIDQGGRVLQTRSNQLDYFEASTDTFGGNSGSGAFDECGTLVGILVRGQTDYVMVGACRKVNVIQCDSDSCSNLARGEELSYPHSVMLANPDCHTNEDCSSAQNCSRACAPYDPSCTGWCVSGPVEAVDWGAKFSRQPSPSPVAVFCANRTVMQGNLSPRPVPSLVLGSTAMQGEGSASTHVLAPVLICLFSFMGVMLQFSRRK